MSDYIIIKNVRCSFPQLWHDQEGEDGKTYGKNITLLLDKSEHANSIKQIKIEINSIIKDNTTLRNACKQYAEKYGPKKALNALKRICLRDEGEESWREEYPMNHMLLKANLPKNSKPPLVLLSNKTEATEETDQIYSGCRVNVKVQLYGMTKHGKTINCKLVAVQFAGNDEPLDASHVSKDTAMQGFEALPDANDAFADTLDNDNNDKNSSDLGFLE